jgi:hypothetical protein
MKMCCIAGLCREKKVKDRLLHTANIDSWKGLIDEYRLGSLGEINLTQLTGKNYYYLLVGNRVCSEGVHQLRDPFSGSFK